MYLFSSFVSCLPSALCSTAQYAQPNNISELHPILHTAGFLVKEESIDQNEQEDALYDATKKYVPSQTIDVYELEHAEFDDEKDEEEIGNVEIWETLQPWLPKIKQIVKDNRNKEGFAKCKCWCYDMSRVYAGIWDCKSYINLPYLNLLLPNLIL